MMELKLKFIQAHLECMRVEHTGQLSMQEIEQSRVQMHQLIDREYDLFLQKLLDGIDEQSGNPLFSYTSIAADPASLKGRKPLSLILPDGRELETHTWRQVVSGVLWHCNEDPVIHHRLMQMRDRVSGKQRIILGASPESMDVPLKLDDGLYMECKYDTETLLRVLRDRVLKDAGCDCSGFVIKCPREPELDTVQEHTAHQEQRM